MELKYKQKWHHYNSSKRKIIFNIISLILLELKEIGYKTRFGGFTDSYSFFTLWIYSKGIKNEKNINNKKVKEVIEKCIYFMDIVGIEYYNTTKHPYEINIRFKKHSTN